MRERLKESPENLQRDKKFTLTIRSLLAAKDEDLRNFWQDKEFLFAFPRMAVYLIGSKGRAEFSQDQRAGLFALSLRTFLSNNNQILSGRSFTKDGQVVSGKRDQKTDSFTRSLTGSILLIGMSLNNKERQMSLFNESYQNLSESKKSNLVDTLGRLLSKNNVTRAWIKENKLDTDNGFDWDLDLAYALFFGIYASRITYLPIPQEMRQDSVKDFSLQTRRVMLNFALLYADNLREAHKNAVLRGFIIQMREMEMAEDMPHKLDLFEQKVFPAGP